MIRKSHEPGEEENNSSIRGGRIEKTHVLGTVIAGKDDVDSGRRCTDVGHLLIVHSADGIGERSRCIDHRFGPHVPFTTRDFIPHARSAYFHLTIFAGTFQQTNLYNSHKYVIMALKICFYVPKTAKYGRKTKIWSKNQ